MIRLPCALISLSQIPLFISSAPSHGLTQEICPSSIWISPLNICLPSSIVSILALYILVLIAVSSHLLNALCYQTFKFAGTLVRDRLYVQMTQLFV